VFDHGILPPPRGVTLDHRSLQKLIAAVRSPAITYTQWLHFAGEILGLNEELARVYFEMYQSFRLQPLTKITTAAGLEAAIDLLEFALYLAAQVSHRESQGSHRAGSVQSKDRWPSAIQTDAGGEHGLSPRSRERRRSAAEERNGRLAFVRNHIGDLLKLLSFQGTFAEKLKPHQLDRLRILVAGRLPSSMEEVGSLCSLAPFWTGKSTDPVPCKDIQRWMLESLSTNKEESISMPVSGSAAPKPGRGGSVVLKRMPAVKIDGSSKTTILRTDAEVSGGPLTISDCSSSYIYVLAHAKYTSILGCQNCVVVVGATASIVSVDNCDNINFVGCCSRLVISNTTDSKFHILSNSPPVLHGDNRGVQLGPFNTFYGKLESHLQQAGLDTTVNVWDQVSTAFAADESSPIAQASLITPEEFLPLAVPFGAATISPGAQNPVTLPPEYMAAVNKKQQAVLHLREKIQGMPMDEPTKAQLHAAVQAKFKEWLVKSGNIRQVWDLVEMEGKGGKSE